MFYTIDDFNKAFDLAKIDQDRLIDKSKEDNGRMGQFS